MPERGFEATGAEVFIFSRQAVREVDRRAVEEFGIPSIVLMENAAIHLADAVLNVLEDAGRESGPVLVVAGTGNNGGDGLAAARHLANAGVQVQVALAGAAEKVQGDAATNLRIVRAMRLPVAAIEGPQAGQALEDLARRRPPAVIVDALFGTGLTGPVRGPAAAVIAAINRIREEGATVVAADLPSGLDAETGEALADSGAVRADVTVSFVGLKRGFLTLAAQEHVGDIMVADIGAPAELVASLGEELPEEVERPGDAHTEPQRAPQRGGMRGRGKGGR